MEEFSWFGCHLSSVVLHDAPKYLSKFVQARGDSQMAIPSCTGRHSFDKGIKMILAQVQLGFHDTLTVSCSFKIK